MIDKMPHLMIPLINEVFSRQYSEKEPVIALQNEHMELTTKKVVSDSYLRIADTYYHVECQSEPDGTMAIRMIEYDFLIALKHAERKGYEYTICYPHSCVLYLRHTRMTPDFLTVHVEFPSGTVQDYPTPIIKLARYEFEEIFEKKLLVLLPYYILRYEKSLPDIERNDTKLHELLDEYQHMYNRLFQMTRKHDISDYDFTELKKLIENIMEQVAVKQPQIKEGVKKLGGKILEFEHDILMRQSEELGEKLGSAKMLVKSVESTMKNLKVPLEEACKTLETTVGEYQRSKELISKDN